MQFFSNVIFIFSFLSFSVFSGIENFTTKAIVFDCDGTLVDNGNALCLEWQYAVKKQGVELNIEEFWHFMSDNHLIGNQKADEMLLKHYCDLFNLTKVKDIVKKDKDEYCKKLNAQGFPPIETTVNFLFQLEKQKKELGLKLAIASAAPKESLMIKLNRLGVSELFDVIVSGFDLSFYNDPEGTNKPKPYIYLHAAKLLGLSPEECVVIEDSITGVTSAVNAGCITVVVPNISTRLEDHSLADFEIDSFANMEPDFFLKMIVDYRKSQAEQK